jgi:peroxiredoxin
MLKIGDAAVAFSTRTADGHEFSLSSLSGTPVILYFFPRAFTPGCTAETKGFRDNYPDLRMLGFQVIGISTDTTAAQCRFAVAHEVPFPMIGDHEQTITRAYGVKWPLLPFARRVTYVLGRDHTVIGVFHHEFQASRHLDDVLRLARQWKSEQFASGPRA